MGNTFEQALCQCIQMANKCMNTSLGIREMQPGTTIDTISHVKIAKIKKTGNTKYWCEY